MGVAVPAAMIAISAVILQAIPDKLVYGNPGQTDTSYASPFTTPIAGESQTATENLASLAGVDDTYYVGSNYTSLYTFLQEQTQIGNITSGSAVYYSDYNNATILYNATFPLWYTGLIDGVLQNALDQVTGGRLIINTMAVPLPTQALQTQVS